jgi:Trypsin-like peptidase domain
MMRFFIYLFVFFDMSFKMTTFSIAKDAVFDTSSLMFIQCNTKDKIQQGTGFIIGVEGYILTAKHLVDGNAVCKGSIGDTGRNPNVLLETKKVSRKYDAALLKFTPGPRERLSLAILRKTDTDILSEQVSVSGFVESEDTDEENRGEFFNLSTTLKQNTTNEGDIFQQTFGAISNGTPDSNGLYRIDALTVGGMSGGPVVLLNTGEVVGIVHGEELTTTARTKYYSATAIWPVFQEFGLVDVKSAYGDAPDRSVINFYNLSPFSKAQLQGGITEVQRKFSGTAGGVHWETVSSLKVAAISDDPPNMVSIIDDWSKNPKNLLVTTEFPTSTNQAGIVPSFIGWTAIGADLASNNQKLRESNVLVVNTDTAFSSKAQEMSPMDIAKFDLGLRRNFILLGLNLALLKEAIRSGRPAADINYFYTKTSDSLRDMQKLRPFIDSMSLWDDVDQLSEWMKKVE